jgi:hypothetical protein
MMETTRIRTGGGGTLRGAVLVLLAAWLQLGVLPVRAAIESMDDVVASCEIQGSSVPSQSEVSSFCSMVRWTSASLYPADNYTVRFLLFSCGWFTLTALLVMQNYDMGTAISRTTVSIYPCSTQPSPALLTGSGVLWVQQTSLAKTVYENYQSQVSSTSSRCLLVSTMFTLAHSNTCSSSSSQAWSSFACCLSVM